MPLPFPGWASDKLHSQIISWLWRKCLCVHVWQGNVYPDWEMRIRLTRSALQCFNYVEMWEPPLECCTAQRQCKRQFNRLVNVGVTIWNSCIYYLDLVILWGLCQSFPSPSCFKGISSVTVEMLPSCNPSSSLQNSVDCNFALICSSQFLQCFPLLMSPFNVNQTFTRAASIKQTSGCACLALWNAKGKNMTQKRVGSLTFQLD